MMFRTASTLAVLCGLVLLTSSVDAGHGQSGSDRISRVPVAPYLYPSAQAARPNPGDLAGGCGHHHGHHHGVYYPTSSYYRTYRPVYSYPSYGRYPYGAYPYGGGYGYGYPRSGVGFYIGF